MSDFILLTDGDDPAIAVAVGQLESWSVQRVDASQLSDAIGNAGVRALLIATSDPTILRLATERSSTRGDRVWGSCIRPESLRWAPR